MENSTHRNRLESRIVGALHGRTPGSGGTASQAADPGHRRPPCTAPAAANAARVGSTVEVLVDGADTSGRCVGRHAGQAPDVDGVCYLTEPVEAGRIVPTRVVGHDEYDLVVERIDNREP